MISVVTGGGGFIGLNLCKLLLDQGEVVCCIDKRSTGYNQVGVSELERDYPNQFINVQMDVVQPEFLYGFLLGLIHSHDAIKIYHLAAESHVDRSIAEPMSFVSTNVIGTGVLLDFKRKHESKCELLIVSTDEVYGDEGPFPTPLHSPLKPSNPYSASKAAADLLVQSYRRTYGLGVYLSHCCNNFGRFQHPEKFIPTIIKSIATSQPVPLYGDGQQERQWVPAKIHAQRLVQMMESRTADQHVGGCNVKNVNLILTIAKIIGRPVEFEHVPDRPGHDVKYQLEDPNAITVTEFENHLSEYVKSELENL